MDTVSKYKVEGYESKSFLVTLLPILHVILADMRLSYSDPLSNHSESGQLTASQSTQRYSGCWLQPMAEQAGSTQALPFPPTWYYSNGLPLLGAVQISLYGCWFPCPVLLLPCSFQGCFPNKPLTFLSPSYTHFRKNSPRGKNC